MTSTPNSTTPTQLGRPWQYSMKTLMLVTLATAVALAIVVSSPNAIAVPLMICLNIAIPAFLTVVLVYGSGYKRTFCIGALFPTCTTLYVTAWHLGLTLSYSEEIILEGEGWLAFFEQMGRTYRVYTGVTWLLAIVIGTAAVGLRWRLEKEARNGKEET